MSHLKRGTDGHLLKNAAGHLAKTCEPPYGECAYCNTGTTPSNLQIVFSGISISYDCLADSNRPAYSGILNSILPYINGTWILPQVSSCDWQYIENGIFGTLSKFCNANCTSCGGKSPYNVFDFIITVSKISNTLWRVWSAYHGADIFRRLTASSCPQNATSVTVANKDCFSFSCDNGLYTPCFADTTVWPILSGALCPAYGGSATITPI